MAVPLCLEYYRWPQSTDTNKNAQQDKSETLLVGDDLGIIHMYNFKKVWHHCEFKNYGYDRFADKVDKAYYNKKVQAPMLVCHKDDIANKFVDD